MANADGPAFVAAAVRAAILAKAPRRTVQAVAAAVTGVFTSRPAAATLRASSAAQAMPRGECRSTPGIGASAEELVAALQEARRARRRRKKENRRAKKREAESTGDGCPGSELDESLTSPPCEDDGDAMDSAMVEDPMEAIYKQTGARRFFTRPNAVRSYPEWLFQEDGSLTARPKNPTPEVNSWVTDGWTRKTHILGYCEIRVAYVGSNRQSLRWCPPKALVRSRQVDEADWQIRAFEAIVGELIIRLHNIHNIHILAPRRTVQAVAAAVTGVFTSRPAAATLRTSSAAQAMPRGECRSTPGIGASAEELVAALQEARRARRRRKKENRRAKKREAESTGDGCPGSELDESLTSPPCEDDGDAMDSAMVENPMEDIYKQTGARRFFTRPNAARSYPEWLFQEDGSLTARPKNPTPEVNSWVTDGWTKEKLTFLGTVRFEWLKWVQTGKVCVGAHPKLWYAAGKLMKPIGKYEHLKPSWAFASWSRSLSTFPLYGLITAVIINGKMGAATYSAYSGYVRLGAGLTAGMSSLAAGLAIGIVGDAGVRANAQQPRLFVGMTLILIFPEALGLYGLIVGLVVASTAEGKGKGLCSPYNV
ncbi:unnamed protein product [Polarella glacialis]|uniref:V-ATPase proteolipid subunit C-like domain-containing protein n=1 Tax=Polarella glacialis TaxID=89957 RepID=A0A813LN18_POLGL|nr:unnamed protein product [Polarella glacialis]